MKDVPNNQGALTNLSDLPSVNDKEGDWKGEAKKEAVVKRKARDAAMTVKAGLKSWNTKNNP